MEIKNFILEVDSDVLDVLSTDFQYSNTNSVPNRSDSFLSFERGVTKKGKTLKTCVLYVDVRNSIALTQKHDAETMGKIYTTFAKSVIKAAKHHYGHVRNIIGDRVMIIFPSANCFTNAVDCAVTINHISKFIINTRFPDVDFKCGIGIDYGEMKVIKVGIQRRGTEAAENKSLVWTGNPANIASRLTDNANKIVKETFYKVIRNPINLGAIKPLFGMAGIGGMYGGFSNYDPKAPFYLSTTEEVEMTTEQFANNISSYKGGELYMSGGNFISFSKKEKTYKYPSILMTDEVYNGFRKSNLTRDSIVNKYWNETAHLIKNYRGKLFGGDVHWEIK